MALNTFKTPTVYAGLHKIIFFWPALPFQRQVIKDEPMYLIPRQYLELPQRSLKVSVEKQFLCDENEKEFKKLIPEVI